MKPIKTAICAFGMSGQVFHAPFIHHNPKYLLRGVLERNSDIASTHYPNIVRYRTMEELLDDQEVDLVIVNTPSVTHYEMAKLAIKANKHVVVEKPFTATSAEASELIYMAEKQSVVLSVFHNRRYDSDFKSLKRVLDSNRLGPIVEVVMRYDRFHPELSYKIHKEEPTPAVGSLYDLGSHLIDQTILLFGMPSSVYADLDCLRAESKVVDYFDLKLYYDRFRVHLKSSYFVKEALPAFVAYGKLGSFIKHRSDPQEMALLNGSSPLDINYGFEPEEGFGILNTQVNGKDVKDVIRSPRGNYMDYFNELADAINNSGSPPITAQDGCKVIEIIECAMKSNTQKKRVVV